MGGPKFSRKKWRGPRHPWRGEALRQELKLVGEYGLRNKRELWRAKYVVEKIRYQARRLLAVADEGRRRRLVERLVKMGLLPLEATLDDVLNLDVSKLLERRLQTLVYRKGLAGTIHQARQLISHRHIAVGNNIVTCPSYLVNVEEEGLIRFSPQSVYATQAVGLPNHS